MTVMCLLRIFADLGFYYAIAGTVSFLFGGRCQFPSLILLAVCYAACARLQKQKQRQYVVLAAAALAVLLPVPAADRVFYLPALAYVFRLVRRSDFEVGRARQMELLETFGRVFGLFSIFWCIALFVFNPEESILIMLRIATRDWLAAGLPMALFAVLSAILLLRSVRHEPAVYLRPKFQAVNVAVIVGIVLFALCASSPWAIRAGIWAYYNVIIPLLLVFFMAIGMLLILLFPLIELLVALITQRKGDLAVVSEEFAALFKQFLHAISEVAGIPVVQILVRAAIALGAIAVALLLIFMFRLLAMWFVYFIKLVRERGRTGPSGTSPRVLPLAPSPERRREARAQNDVERVRRQYRTFLRLCRKYGVSFGRASTSGEISAAASRAFEPEAPVGDIRDIYRKARYRGEASREDASRLRKLCVQVRKLHPRKR